MKRCVRTAKAVRDRAIRPCNEKESFNEDGLNDTDGPFAIPSRREVVMRTTWQRSPHSCTAPPPSATGHATPPTPIGWPRRRRPGHYRAGLGEGGAHQHLLWGAFRYMSEQAVLSLIFVATQGFIFSQTTQRRNCHPSISGKLDLRDLINLISKHINS